MKKMNQQQKIEDLEAQLAEKNNDIEELAVFVIKTFKAMGVKQFDDLDNVGKTVMKAVPKLLTEATIQQHKFKMRFEHFNQSKPLLDKYEHLIHKQFD